MAGQSDEPDNGQHVIASHSDQVPVASEPESWREVMAEVTRLRAEVEHLRAKVSAGGARANVDPAVATAAETASDFPAPATDPRWSRRGMLLGALGVAASATAAVAGATPAAATTGTMRFGADSDAGADRTNLLSSHPISALGVNNYGVGSAIQATTSGNWGAIHAYASSGPGLYAESTDGHGVYALGANRGSGIRAWSLLGSGADLESAYGPTMRLASGHTTVPRSGDWLAGDVVAARPDGGAQMELWLCVKSGSPGQWRQLAGPTVAGGLVPIRPVRVYDSRWSGVPGVVTGQLQPGTRRVVSVADGRDATGAIIGRNAVPQGATAVTLNVTVVDTVGRGNLAVVPDGGAGSVTSSINWSATGQVLANGLTMGINTLARTLDVLCRSNPTHVVIDVSGYYSGA